MKHTTKIMLQNYDISYYARRKQEIGSLYSCLRCTCFIISAALGGCGTLGLLMYYASDACDTYMLSCENYIPTRKQVLSIPANYNAPTNSWYALLQLDTCLIPVPDQPRFRNQYDAIDYVEKNIQLIPLLVSEFQRANLLVCYTNQQILSQITI